MKSLYSADNSKNLGSSGTVLDNSGRNGITPHIGPGNHWFIGTYDTGVSAQGTINASIDVDKRTITIDNKTLSIPETVDLSEYYTKQETDEAINAHQVDLSDYLKKDQLPDMSKYVTTSSVESMLTGLGSIKSPTIYDMTITLADLQNPIWGGPRYMHGDNSPFRIDKFNQGQVRKKKPEVGVDYCKGLDGVIRKLTGYTVATGEYWLSFDFILAHATSVYSFNDRVFKETEDVDYTAMMNPQRNNLKLYLVPGDLLIDEDNNVFEVGFCYNNYNGGNPRSMAQLVQLNREAKPNG